MSNASASLTAKEKIRRPAPNWSLDTNSNLPIQVPKVAPKGRWIGKLHFPLSKAIQCLGRADQLIRHWLPAAGVSFLLAQFGVGKTLLLLDQALCLATDCDWMGFPTSRGRFAVYLSGEDQEGTLANAEAWYVHHGIDPKDAYTRILFGQMTPDLMDAKDCEELVRSVRSQLPPGARPVIFIDTWQRATSAGGQNEDKDMQLAIRNAEYIGKELGGPVVIASHPPKNNPATINGSGVIQNSSVAIWTMMPVKKSTTVRTVSVTRIKGAGQGTDLSVAIVAKEIEGKDSFGCQRTGAVLVRREREMPSDWPVMTKVSNTKALSSDALELLKRVAENPNLSFVKQAEGLHWFGHMGTPNESRVKNRMEELKKRKLVVKSAEGSYIVSSEGITLVQELAASG